MPKGTTEDKACGHLDRQMGETGNAGKSTFSRGVGATAEGAYSKFDIKLVNLGEDNPRMRRNVNKGR